MTQLEDRLAIRTTHPLQPLACAEIADAIAILQAERGVHGDRYRFVQVSLVEPPKRQVLTVEYGAQTSLERLARAILVDRTGRAAIEATVSLDRRLVTDWTEIGVGQPPMTLSELLACGDIVRHHPDFRAALAKRGLTEVELAWIDPWSPGAYDDEPEHLERRWARGIIWTKLHPDEDNGYAHPIENVLVLFDLYAMEVIRVDDFGVVPVPRQSGDYDAANTGPIRPGLKPLVITQPDGPSFTVDD
ncbi:MAG: tyramine oxidase, partial [Chloroflexota bacterium]|nr:tyramine oxidase [Chloroflexota bacterium]